MKQQGTVKLHTQRLTLRKMRLTDYFDARHWYCDGRVNTYSRGKPVNSKKDLLAFLLRHVYNYYVKRRRSYYYWGIYLEHHFIGFVGFWQSGLEHVMCPYYMLSPEEQGNGYMKEALQAAVDYMRTQQLRGLLGACDAENLPSYHCMLHCGFMPYLTQLNAYHYPDGRTGNRTCFKIRFETK